MKRTIYFLPLLVLGIVALIGLRYATLPAATDKISAQTSESTDIAALNQPAKSTHHKIFVDAKDTETYQNLSSRGAIVSEVDYGSFKMLLIDDQNIGGRTQLAAMNLDVRDEQNFIPLNGYLLDTTDGKLSLNPVPEDLRQTATTENRAEKGLYIVQFIGPIKDEWLAELKQTGGEIITYIPNNAYIVRMSAKAAPELAGLREKNFVQFVGDYEPAFRLAPELQFARQNAVNELIDVTVQLIDGANAKADLAALQNIAEEFIGERKVLNYRNVQLKVRGSRLGEIVSLDNVFAVEQRTEKRRLDEAQGQIIAGNLSGNSPTGPGYLTWLAGKGFNSSQFGTFAVNVADDAYQLTGASQHPDLPASRVAFQNNPTGQSGVQQGHGFLNSNIIGGFNNGTGAAFEDANGYNYGLGIAPWSRVGITAIFGATSSTPTAWENTAYGQNARISSNSWGFTGAAAKKYDTNAQEYDRIVRDAQSGTAGNQQLIVVFAAGNDGSAANTVSSPATAKNIITAGASENVRQTGTDGCAVANSGADSANDIINFSSRGPVNTSGSDGRIKPDIMAPGTHIEAGIPQSNYDGTSVCNKYFPAGQTLYGWSSGTSHSCPAVAGASALLYQDFLNKSLGNPSPALAKAVLMNSAAYMNGTGANDTLPSNNQGMGRMDLGRTFDGTPRLLTDQTQVFGSTGQTYSVTGSVADTSKPYRVTLAWTDAPGPTTGAPFVNNLDLEVTINGTTYKGNVFSGANSVSGGAADTKNNAESVFLPAGTSGNFTVTVKATNIAGDGVPGNADTTDQDFALVVYNANASTSTSPTIAVNPSSLSFSGTQGGANPAGQTLNITNAGSGTLNWTASSNQSWLSISSISGTAPSSPSVSVNTTSLAAGTYNGTITVSAAGATNSPVAVPVTLTVTTSGGGCGAQLITNGGFETGTTPWTLSGAIRSTGAYPHSGTAYSILGGANSISHTEYQDIAIPNGCAPNLSFWLNVTSDETTTSTQYDKLFVEVRNTSGTLLTTLATFSNLNKGTAGSYVQRGTYSLAAYGGQTVRIQFRATTDSSLQTTFRVDDVSAQ